MSRVVIAAGGTAGHVVPALAVAEALVERGAEVSFVGTAERAEASLVPAAGFEIDFLAVEGLDRRNPLRAARALWRSARAIGAARRILAERGAEVVVGGGGYVAGPVGVAAIATRLPLVLTEADSRLGLTNRLLARRARRICLAFPIEGRSGERYSHTGRPVSKAVLEVDRGAARARLGVAEGRPLLVIFGGSLGARTVNLAALDAFARADSGDRGFDVFHVTGSRDFKEIEPRVSGVDGYRVREYLPDLGDPLAAADLVLSRAGGSVFELTATGKPAVLVPYPHASGRHQHANAEWMRRAGAAVVVEDSELDPGRLRAMVDELLFAGDRLAEMGRASASLAMPDAARRIAATVLEAASAGEARGE